MTQPATTSIAPHAATARAGGIKERPILFSAPMIPPILADIKTQTRRLIKPVGNDEGFVVQDYGDGFWPYRSEDGESGFYRDRHGYDMEERIKCPYGQPGARLWVRETWGYRCSSSTQQSGLFMNTIGYRADDARQTFGPMPMDGVGLPQQRERAPDEPHEKWEAYLNRYWRQWRPSIHMPRWASRITLEVTDVKVERLQDISEEDAMAEGIVNAGDGNGYQLADTSHYAGTASESYASLWESINGPGSWDANPWVWCVSFKRLEAA